MGLSARASLQSSSKKMVSGYVQYNSVSEAGGVWSLVVVAVVEAGDLELSH